MFELGFESGSCRLQNCHCDKQEQALEKCSGVYFWVAGRWLFSCPAWHTPVLCGQEASRAKQRAPPTPPKTVRAAVRARPAAPLGWREGPAAEAALSLRPRAGPFL